MMQHQPMLEPGARTRESIAEEARLRSVLAHRLKFAIRRARVTQKRVAEVTGVNDQAVSLWVRTGEISVWRLPKLAAFLGTTVDWLLGSGPEEPAARVPESSIKDTAQPPNDREVLWLFGRLPESDQQDLLKELRAKVAKYDALYEELRRRRTREDPLHG
jgi:transcriptional regulator with XRE-family HTH domain